MSDITKAFEAAILAEISVGGEARQFREDPETESRKYFGVLLGQMLTNADLDRLMESIKLTGLSVQEFAVKAIRDATDATLARARSDAEPGGEGMP